MPRSFTGMRHVKRITSGHGAALIAMAAMLSWPADAKGPVDPVNKDGQGVALKGFDAVAYFEQGKPVRGSSAISQDWMGAKWLFSSPANRELFRANPAKYAPQFGGYCAWAVSHNYTANTDPEAWKIVDGRLYLNYSKSVQGKWEKDIPKYIDDGNRNWPGLHGPEEK